MPNLLQRIEFAKFPGKPRKQPLTLMQINLNVRNEKCEIISIKTSSSSSHNANTHELIFTYTCTDNNSLNPFRAHKNVSLLCPLFNSACLLISLTGPDCYSNSHPKFASPLLCRFRGDKLLDNILSKQN